LTNPSRSPQIFCRVHYPRAASLDATDDRLAKRHAAPTDRRRSFGTRATRLETSAHQLRPSVPKPRGGTTDRNERKAADEDIVTGQHKPRRRRESEAARPGSGTPPVVPFT